MLRFLIFGAFNTGLTYGTYCLLVYVLHPQVAYLIVFALGIAFAYIGNSQLVFNTPLGWKGAGIYPFIYFAQYLFTAFLIHSFGAWLDIGPRFSLALALVITTPMSFFINKIMLNKSAKSVWRTPP